MKIAIFLGAGAAAAEGAPLQAKLFKSYFESLRSSGLPVMHSMDKELATFFQLMFGIDVYADDLTQVDFPTFEEALGILDLAVARGESFRDFDLVNMAGNSGRILAIRVYLVILLAKAIKDGLDTAPLTASFHAQLIENLESLNLLEQTTFITTNYDLLLDNALINHRGLASGSPVDYALTFANDVYEWPLPSGQATRVLKVHGSLNWLFCSTCNTIRYTPLEKGIVRLYEGSANCACPDCESVFEPLIVPPTFFKNMGNVFLTQIWHAAEQTLRKADQVIFCGYSFPDADLHIKYLLKRALRSGSDMRIKIINNYIGKPSGESKAEESRYKRFLGRKVDYTKDSFQDFSGNPAVYMA